VYFVDTQTSLMFRTVRQAQVCSIFVILYCVVVMGWSRINCTKFCTWYILNHSLLSSSK